jgi:hypothetical protein
VDQAHAEPAEIALRWDHAMRRGDFEGAWRQTDRIEIPRRAAQRRPGFVRLPQQLTWNGEPFAGRDVLVRCEHGLGDTLQFVRYVPLIRRVARSVTLLVQPGLVELLRHNAAFGDVRNGWSGETPSHDVAIEVMEFAYAFRSTCDTLPAHVPYLAPEPLESVKRTLPPLDGGSALRVGIAWCASDWDDTRSIPLDVLSCFAEVPNVHFYSLQQGTARDSWREAPFALDPYSRHTESVEHAAAAMLGLDLVITVDSMVAHLAGALGRTVWVLLKHRADWRWMERRDDSPWYPTMRLIRQSSEGDWSGAARAAASLLSELARAKALRSR